MGLSRQVESFKAPPRKLPGKIIAFQRKLMDFHDEVAILESGPVTPGVKRMMLTGKRRLEKAYSAIVPEVRRLEEAGVLFRYLSRFWEAVSADIIKRGSIEGCPILVVCNPDRVTPGPEKEQPYRAHYTPPDRGMGTEEDIVLYASFYPEVVRAVPNNTIDTETLRKAYWENCDLMDVIPLIPEGISERAKLAIGAYKLMSPEFFGMGAERLSDQKLFESLIHELTHLIHSREAGGAIFPEGCSPEDEAVIRLSAEMLAHASVLLYSNYPRPTLGSLLAGQLTPKPSNESSRIIDFFNLQLLGSSPPDFQEILPHYLALSPEDIREIAGALLDSVSDSLFSKPWAEVAPEPAYEEAKNLVFGE